MQTIWLSGHADYEETLRLQENMVQNHIDTPALEDELLLLEHASVYTIGRTRDTSSLGDSSALPHPVVEINRGGQATYHGPGQLVGYPITDLNRLGRDLRAYIQGMESCLIASCSDFGVKAQLREGLIGVWVENRKLISIGVGVRKWIAMHGFAINILKKSLPPFLCITPCGIQHVVMTCLEDEMTLAGVPVPQGDLLHLFGESFAGKWQTWLNNKRNKDNG